MSHPQLRNAPIVEAVIDIRTGVRFETLGSFVERVAAEYPDRKTRFAFSASMKFSSSEDLSVADSARHPDGFVLRSPDHAQVVQARVDGFTFSRLAPYTDWASVQAEARRLWTIFQQVTDAQLVTRLAVRYVNRLRLPPEEELSDYLRTYPEIAPAVPQVFTDLFMKLALIDQASGAKVILTEASEPPPASGDAADPSFPVVLDIDAFFEKAFRVEGEEIWTALAELRTLKNDVFFGSLTEKALKAYL